MMNEESTTGEIPSSPVMKINLHGLTKLQAKVRAAGREISDFLNRHKHRENVSTAGWLPHPTNEWIRSTETWKIYPPKKNGSHIQQIRDDLLEYYRVEWPNLKVQFTDLVEDAAMSDDAKAAMLTALDLHSAKKYEAVVRYLFPELEREIRNRILHASLGGMDGIYRFRNDVYNLDINYLILIGPYFENTMKFESHLYANITPENFAHFEDDPVPNRHAACHGFLRYDQPQNSINMIIMADWIFRAVAAYEEKFKEFRAEQP